MRKNIIFFILCFIYSFFIINCSGRIKLIDIVDDTFQFDKIGYSKTYELSTYLDSFDIGIYFSEQIPMSDIELGILDVKITFDNNKETLITTDSYLRIFYSDFSKKLVNKVVLTNIDLENTFFVKEISISTRKAFCINSELQLQITNRGSHLIYDK